MKSAVKHVTRKPLNHRPAVKSEAAHTVKPEITPEPIEPESIPIVKPPSHPDRAGDTNPPAG